MKAAWPVVGAAALALIATPLRADSQTWRMCTPGAFRSCNSVTLITTPIIEGGIRTGTVMTIQVANLAGSPGFTTDPWSALTGIGFLRKGAMTFGTYGSSTGGWVYGEPNGGAVGTPIGTNYSTYGTFYGVPQYIFPLVFGTQIEGCMLVHYTNYTCGTGAFIGFTFSTNAIFDASEINTMSIGAKVANVLPHDPGYGTIGVQCWSDPGELVPPNPPDNPQCEMLTTATPEPVSMVLLGTGLAGVVAARRRRPRQDG